MRIVSVVGTRPQLIKAAALQPAIDALHDAILVDTGQHHDDALAGAFFRELRLRAPDHSLGVTGGTHADQTGRMLLALEPILLAERPNAVLVYGDTNSTLAGALTAAKLGIRVAHVEAGLRSFDRTMPEEINRIVADHIATWRFAPTAEAVSNLAAEGVVAGVHEVGDPMQDLASRVLEEVRDPAALARIDCLPRDGAARGALVPGSYVFATVHRAGNREPDAMRAWAAILDAATLPDRPVVLALHPGTRAALEAGGFALSPSIRIVPSLGYRSSLALQLHAAAVITDSGGVQRESSWLGTPCLVLRERTEWTELLEGASSTSVLVGLDERRAADALARLAAVEGARDRARERAATAYIAEAGAAERIAAVLADA